MPPEVKNPKADTATLTVVMAATRLPHETTKDWREQWKSLSADEQQELRLLAAVV